MKKINLVLAFFVAVLVVSIGSICFAGKTITIQGVEGQDAKLIRLMTPEFEKQTGIKVIFDFVTYENVRQKQVLEMAAKRGTYDVVMVDDVWAAEYAKAGYLEDLTPFVEKYKYDLEGIVPTIRDFGKIGDKLVGLPVAPGAGILAYQKDILEKAGINPPETMDEFLEAAGKLAQDLDNDGVVDIFGVSTMMKRDTGTLVEWLHYLWGYGGDWLKDGKPAFNNEAGKKAMEFHSQLGKFAPPGALATGIYEHITQFASGKAVFGYLQSMWATNYENPKLFATKVAGKLGYVPMPKGPQGQGSLLCGWALGIPKDSKNKEEAFQYIAFLTGEEGQWMYAMAGGCAARTKPLASPILQETWPYLKAHYEASLVGVLRPRVPEYVEIENIMVRELSLAYSGEKGFEQALKDAAAETEKALGKQ